METILPLITVVVGTFTAIFIFNLILNKQYLKVKSNDEPGINFNIVKSVIFLSSGLIMAQIPEPESAIIKVLSGNNATGGNITIIAYTAMIIMLTVLFCLLTYGCALTLFSVCTKGKNLMIEISNEKTGLSICFAGIQLGISIALSHAIPFVIDYFIPYQDIPRFGSL